VHPYLTLDGQKLSKSLGTTVEPAGFVDKYGTDALRWFFAREVGAVSDTELHRRPSLNSDLATTEPWKVTKDLACSEELELILARQVATARVIAAAIQPIVPSVSKRLRHQRGGNGNSPLPAPRPAFAASNDALNTRADIAP
jgi:methionyl-tRNA synthetase